VSYDVIAEGVPPSRLRVSIVRFSPGAHTAWHRHANGQTLHVTEGRGLVQAWGAEVVEVRPGDTIYTPPAEWHWHGAAPGHFMSHLSMSEDLAEGQEGPVTEWGEHLTDEEYPAG
jgi:quercetin dioxygenase-like cupin family protein